MKKKYIRPKTIVVDLELEDLLLTGSADGYGPGGTEGTGSNPSDGFPGDEEQVIPGI